jgi:hypothetical protein
MRPQNAVRYCGMHANDSPSPRRRSWTSIASLVALALAVLLAWTRFLDVEAERSADAGLKRALASFAIARTLNAVISVAKGTEVAVQPAGMGMTFTPGEALEPIDDMVEQFASVMLAATVAFAIQKVLISIGAHWVFALLLTAAALAWTAFRLQRGTAPRAITLILLALLFVRFVAPVVTTGSDVVFKGFLAKSYEDSQAAVTLSSRDVASMGTPRVEEPTPEGITDRIRKWWSGSSDGLRVRFEQLKDSAERAVEHMVHLIVVFLMQTAVVPGLLLWALVRLGSTIGRLASR